MFAAFVIRGFADYFRAPEGTAKAGVAQAQRIADPGPFAALFATTLLTWAPDRIDAQHTELEGMVGGSATEVLQVAGDRSQRVVSAWPEHPQTRGARSTVRVTCRVASRGRTRTMYIAVPVVEDKAGVQSVDDYPALVAASTPLATRTGVLSPLQEGQAEAIVGLLTRVFRQYLAGDELIPELLAPGVVVQSPAQPRLVLTEVGDPAEVGKGTATSKRIAVNVTARDRRSQAMFTFSYRVGVTYRAGRWLVSSLKG